MPEPPLAYLYDRLTTPAAGLPALRLRACRDYADRAGFEVGGEWCDEGPAALLDARRPQLAALMLATAAARRRGRTVVVVIHSLSRLSGDPQARVVLSRRITSLGATIETVAAARADWSAR